MPVATIQRMKRVFSKNHISNDEIFRRLIFGLKRANLSKPIFVRISPQESLQDMHTTARIMRKSGIVSAVMIPNSWSVAMPLDDLSKPILNVPLEKIGQSGPRENQ